MTRSGDGARTTGSHPTITTTAPTVTTTAPTVTTTAPTVTTTAPTVGLPCCETLRLNAIFCCLESRFPAMMARECQECGTK